MRMKQWAIGLAALLLAVSTTWSVDPAQAHAHPDDKRIFVTNSGDIVVNDAMRVGYEHSDQFPFVYNGSTYLPVRAISQALGKQVRLDNATSTLHLHGRSELPDEESYTNSTFWKYSQVNGEWRTVRQMTLQIEVDGAAVGERVQALLYKGALFLPMRTLAGYLNAGIYWDADRQRVDLYNAPNGVKTAFIPEPGVGIFSDNNSRFLASFGKLAPLVATVVNPEDGSVHVAWQDRDNNKLHIQTMDAELNHKASFSIPFGLSLFGAFTVDGEGNFYILWGDEVEESGKNRVNVKISKHSPTGAKLGEAPYIAGEQSARGTKQPFDFANAKLRYNNGLVVAHFGRVMFKSADGLNHQSSTALYVDAATMRPVNLNIPYVSHSFDQEIAFDGDFIIFVDRGDAYPRGFEISQLNRQTNVLYTTTPFYFKMGDMYQNTYSQLGGLAVADEGYVLVGTSERSAQGEQAHNESRNLFMQLIDKQLDGQGSSRVLSRGTTYTIDIPEDSPGDTGRKTNEGVVWLTDYTDKIRENAAHPKVARIENNRFLIMWEQQRTETSYVTSSTYETTWYMVVSAYGDVIKRPTELPGARLNTGDTLSYAGGAAYWAVSNSQSVVVHKLDL